MNDNLISTILGSISSVVYTLITWGDIWKVFLFGIIGGIAGYIGKFLVKSFMSKINKLIEKHKINKNANKS